MKELEKTRRISIAAVVFIVAILAGLLSYKRPLHMYAVNTQDALNEIKSNDFLVTANDIKELDHVLIDLRSKFEFEKGHLENALNIYGPEILSEKNTEILNELTKKTVVLYGENPNTVTPVYLTLLQLGHSNLKILKTENLYTNNKFVSKEVSIEKANGDIPSFIAESVKKAAAKPKPKPVVKKPPKKIIPKKKKKKMPVEGGC